jgi:hypothetical protein
MLMRVVAVAVMATLTSSCAKRADQIAASYVSPLQYDGYDCRQLGEEAQRISSRAGMVAGTQDEKANKDALAMGVGLIIFWPALFALSGNDQQTAELARLRGEMEAIEQVSVRKRCGIQFQTRPPA